MARPRFTIGGMLLAIASLHVGVGVLTGLGLDPTMPIADPPLPAMLREGLVDSVRNDPWRLAFSWFLLCGFVLAVVGALSRQSELRGLPPSRWFAVSLGALCITGAVLMPTSGVWLVMVPAGFALQRSEAR